MLFGFEKCRVIALLSYNLMMYLLLGRPILCFKPVI